jgi:small subunit ribosomal protein S16
MLKIRMQRTGRINQPSYRIIVTEHARAAKTGSFLEELGTYNPATKVRTLKDERVKYWISVGAQPSDTMHNMLVSAGVIKGKKINVLPKKTVPKKEGEAEVATAPAAAAAAAAPVAEEKAAEETPAEATNS